MNFIAIEGLDGSGKSTQVQMLEQYLSAQGRPTKFLHFPRTETASIFGDLVAKFLRGGFGGLHQVDPYLVALVFAEDRRAAAPLLQQWLSEGYFVIVDRYVYSNVAFQCAKVADPAEQHALRDWIVRLEYEEFGLPQPQLSLFLDVPPSFTQQKLQQTRTGSERDYLQGKQDIHEASLDFQQAVRKIYLQQAALDPGFCVIPCADEQGEMLQREDLFEKIKQRLA